MYVEHSVSSLNCRLWLEIWMGIPLQAKMRELNFGDIFRTTFCHLRLLSLSAWTRGSAASNVVHRGCLLRDSMWANDISHLWEIDISWLIKADATVISTIVCRTLPHATIVPTPPFIPNDLPDFFPTLKHALLAFCVFRGTSYPLYILFASFLFNWLSNPWSLIVHNGCQIQKSNSQCIVCIWHPSA